MKRSDENEMERKGWVDLILVAIVAFIEVVAVLTSWLPVNRVVKDLLPHFFPS